MGLFPSNVSTLSSNHPKDILNGQATIHGNCSPVCSKPVKTLEYYPRSLCPECSARVTDRSGRPVVFYDIQVLPAPNSSGVTLLGGFYGYYANTGLQETYSSSTCYVDGITCEAKNARFGGIVIEAL